MKSIAVLWMVWMVAGHAWSEKLGELRDVLMPQTVKVDGNELFVVEDHFIYIYTLDDLKLKARLGKSGQGPGEFNLDPSRTIVLSVFPDKLMAESRFKIISYSRDGAFLEERKKNPNVLQTLPVGSHFAVLRLKFEDEGKLYFSVDLLDGEFNELKELYRQKFFQFENKVYLMPDALHFTVVENKIFVDESPDGYVIEVFDAKGNSVDVIRRDWRRLEVFDAHKKQALDDYLDIPFFKRMIDQNGKAAFQSYIKQQNFVYPETFPAIEEMVYADGKLYVKTFEKEAGQEVFYVHDLADGGVEKLKLPEVQKVPFLVRVQGDKKTYTFDHGTFYYLKHIDVEEDEYWEVHALKVG